MYDIAPLFREAIARLPIDALNTMEEALSVSNSRAIQYAIADIQAEKARRNKNTVSSLG